MVRLNERNAILTRTLPDGRVLDLFPLVLDRVRLAVSENAEAQGFQEAW